MLFGSTAPAFRKPVSDRAFCLLSESVSRTPDFPHRHPKQSALSKLLCPVRSNPLQALGKRSSPRESCRVVSEMVGWRTQRHTDRCSRWLAAVGCISLAHRRPPSPPTGAWQALLLLRRACTYPFSFRCTSELQPFPSSVVPLSPASVSHRFRLGPVRPPSFWETGFRPRFHRLRTFRIGIPNRVRCQGFRVRRCP